jgi:hypothetical protein
MRALIAALALTLALPGAALAHDRDWSAEIPKGGGPVLECVASATVNGHSYTNRNYSFTDADEYAKDAVRDSAWQRYDCDTTGRRAVVNYFHNAEGVDISPADVTIKMRLLP